MEDSARALPEGWVRHYDPETHHQFFVDTRATPPRSTWHHPHDDEQYIASLPDKERERIKGLQREPSLEDIKAESSDDDTGSSHGQAEAASDQQRQQPDTGPEKLSRRQKFGRMLKDALTDTTHQERAAERERRAEAERRADQQYLHKRRLIERAIETDEPQLLGRDPMGKEVWVEPPKGAPDLHGNPNVRVISTGGYFGGPPGMTAGSQYTRPVAPLIGLGVGLGMSGMC